MKKESIPRKKITDFSKNEPIYLRYGFSKIEGKNLIEERDNYIKYLKQKTDIKESSLDRLVSISKKYYSFLMKYNLLEEKYLPYKNL